MKRTFAVIGFSFMLGLIICNFLLDGKSVYLALISFVLSAVFVSVGKLRKNKEICCLFICLFLSSSLFSAVRHYIYNPSLGYADTKCEIEATVLDTPSISSGGNYSYLIRTKSINGEKKSVKMRLYVPYDISSEPYDEIAFSAYPFIIGSNDRGTYLHFRSRGTYLGAYTKYDVRLHTPEKKPFMSVFPTIKLQSMKILSRLLGEKYAAFSISLLFGDKIYIDPQVKQDFRTVGLTHIMAVSGLHMSVWVYGLYRLLKRVHVGEKKASLISIAFSLCVVCFSSFSVSVIRAMIMTAVYLSSGLFSRRSDALNSLGLSVFLICAVNPFAVCDVSFLLSVFSTLGIILSSETLSHIRENPKKTRLKTALEIKPVGYAVESLALSVSAAAFTYPIALGIFGGVSLISPLVNLLVIPTLAPCLMMSGLMTALPNLGILTDTIGYALTVFERYIFFVVESLAKLRLAYAQTDSLIFCVAIPSAVALAMSVLYSIKDKKLNVTELSVSASVIIIAIFYYI